MIYDIRTSNESFKKFAKFLKDKHVKNYASHLILYDESLQGVDPFSESLTKEQKAKIYAELSINPWYYFREVVRFDSGTRGGKPFECHIGSYMIVWSHTKNVNTFTVLSRQLGKTTSHLAWFAWLMMFGVQNQYIVFSLQDHVAKKTILGKWRWYIDALPPWLKTLVVDYNDQNSTEEKSLARNNNKILSFGGAVNEDGADRSARSFTTGNLLMDEVAFFKFNQDFFKAASQATNTAIENARNNKTHYGIHMTTTPNRRDEGSREGSWAYKFFNSAAPFRYEILDYSAEELRNYLRNNSYDGSDPTGFLRLEFDWRDCGKPQEWYEDAIRLIGGDMRKIKQELDLVWPETDDGSIFSEAQTAEVAKFSNKDIVQTLKFSKDRFYLDFYEPMNPMATYLISIDTAAGFGIDGTAINVIDPIDYHIVASLNSNKIGAVELEEIIKELMLVWFPAAYLIIEAAPIAIPIIQRLIVIPNIEKRLFKRLVETLAERKLSDGTIKSEKVKVWRYGVSTNSKTRPQMMDMLLSIVKETPFLITSPKVYNDIRNLRYNKGKIEAGNGSHDDSIMSYLIARWSIAYSSYFKNKKFVGGMLTRDVLTEGSKIEYGIDHQISGFNSIISLGGTVTTSAPIKKSISSAEYAERAERQAKQEENKNTINRRRFSAFLEERY